ncbi:DUF4262 domain-containing protein [Bradyrhizobium sp.]|uniref:DUF4262 domain-containing protein n=1 Tax=Bradyrhizobium sp. TaxID=376 RepID=UPI0025BD8165|nr:DUF4262 domain-containing protein [Bradyrhizobium sp.]MBV8922498.1 DUF4262 domain-containing protein [Bradyrhizobium sp.]
MLDEFEWPRPDNDADERIVGNVRKHGCHIVGIMPDEERPGYAFSIGLFVNYGHPEIVIFGLDRRDAGNVINDIRDRVSRGQRYAAGDVGDQLLVGHKACFADVPPRPFPCLQLVWPDRAGRFPWQAEFDPALRKYQPLLRGFS